MKATIKKESFPELLNEISKALLEGKDLELDLKCEYDEKESGVELKVPEVTDEELSQMSKCFHCETLGRTTSDWECRKLCPVKCWAKDK